MLSLYSIILQPGQSKLEKIAPLLASQSLLRLCPGIIILVGITLAISLCYGDYKELTHKSLSTTTKNNNSLPAENTVISYGNGRKHLTGLFGQLPINSEQEPESPDKYLPDTRLSLVLQGTFTNAKESKASALITQNNTRPKQYLSGDEIASGVKLVAVYPGYVILRRNGRDESLKMPILEGERQSSLNTSSTTQVRTSEAPKYSTANGSHLYSQDIQQRLQRSRAKARETLDDDGDFD